MSTIQVGICTDEVNKVHKDIRYTDTINGRFNDDIDLLRPSIVLEGHYSGFNYVYIAELKRYYYVNNVTINSDSVYTVSLTIDVLKTYEDKIEQMYQSEDITIVRSSKKDYFNSEHILLSQYDNPDIE